MKKLSIRKLFIPAVYLTAVLLVVGSIYLTISGINKYLEEKKDFDYAIDGLTKTPLRAVQGEDNLDNNGEKIIRPYTSEKVSVGRYYYDFESESQKQENSIIFFENTYMQNTGVDYVSDETFNVISVLPGKILSVEKDEILGNIVKIEHEKDIITVYEGIDNITLKAGDIVKQGDVIGISATSNINANYPNSLHFEVYYNGKAIDPENFYTLNINDL